MKWTGVCLVLAFAALCQADLPRKPDGKVDWSKIEFPNPKPFTAAGLKADLERPKRDPLPYSRGEEDYSSICGIPRNASDNSIVKPHIVGGQEASPHRYPWVCSVYINGASFCTCSLISNKWILIAAHCAGGITYEVFLGAHDLDDPNEEGRISITTTESYTHPEWSAWTLSNDVALIKLPEPIEFTDKIRPHCLPPRSLTKEKLVGETVKSIGWGRPSDAVWTISPQLREVDLQVISKEECNNVYGIISDTQICTSNAEGKGVCNGDSGGPLSLVVEGGKRHVQVGVASFVHVKGCESGEPHGFARVLSHLDWLESRTNILIQDNYG